jgi:hypothetical protein
MGYAFGCSLLNAFRSSIRCLHVMPSASLLPSISRSVQPFKLSLMAFCTMVSMDFGLAFFRLMAAWDLFVAASKADGWAPEADELEGVSPAIGMKRDIAGHKETNKLK